jgi:hypothetical protein
MKHPIPKLTDEDMEMFAPTDDAVLARIEDILSQSVKLSGATLGLLEGVRRKLALAPKIYPILTLIPRRGGGYLTSFARSRLADLRLELIRGNHHQSSSGEELLVLVTESLAAAGPVKWQLPNRLDQYTRVGQAERKKIDNIYMWMCRLMQEPGAQEKTQEAEYRI